MIRDLLADGPATIATAAVFGLVSSAHCLGMCGGIAAAQGAKHEHKHKSVLMYCGGRLLSYTVVGFIVGLTGSLLGMNQYLKALIPLISGLITVFIGLQQLGLFRWLTIGKRASENCLACRLNRFGPFAVGLLTGIMPCGTLQTVQYAALSSGSALSGAGIMFAFGLTSSPALGAVGVLSGLLTTRGKKIFTIVAALIVIVMGVKMIIKGLTLLGVI